MSQYMSSAIRQKGNSQAPAEQSQEYAWVSASQRGDVLSFNRLVLKWEKPIYNFALRMLREQEEAAEATQEIFLLAYKGIRRFRRDSRFSTWLYRIAVNHCVTRSRRKPQGIHLSLDEDATGTKSFEQLRIENQQDGELLRSEQRRRVLNALTHLPAEQQAVIDLKFFQEMTFEEIAESLNMPISTVKSRLYSGLEILKVRLGTPD
jgi:RNA polymerase sigma-70 factor (ECF subfamily)